MEKIRTSDVKGRKQKSVINFSSPYLDSVLEKRWTGQRVLQDLLSWGTIEHDCIIDLTSPYLDEEILKRRINGQVDQLISRAQNNPNAKVFLKDVLIHVMHGVYSQILEGNGEMTSILMDSISEFIVKFERDADAKPEQFQEWAGQRFQVPVMTTRRYNRKAEHDQLLKKIKQGERHPVKVIPSEGVGRSWTMKDSYPPIAFALVSIMGSQSLCAWFDQDFLCPSRHQPQNKRGRKRANHHNVKSSNHDMRKLTKPFSLNNFEEWFDAGWLFLRRMSPEWAVELNPLFCGKNAAVLIWRENGVIWDGSAKDARLRNLIKTNLKSAFKTIAK